MFWRPILGSLAVGFGLLAGGLTASAATTDTPSLKLRVVSTTGKTLQPTHQLQFSETDLMFGGLSAGTYMPTIKGYLPYKLGKDYAPDRIPTKLTLKYVKTTTVAKKVAKQYLKQINAYRKKKHLKPFRHQAALTKKAKVRAKELRKKPSHVRPNGTSYNAKNSGYAEVMAYTPAQFYLQANKVGNVGQPVVCYKNSGTISYKNTAKTASTFLLTVDQVHRQTELNTWARYSAVSFTFKDDFSGTMAQLFRL